MTHPEPPGTRPLRRATLWDMRSRARSARVGLVVACAVALAACGNDDASTDGSTPDVSAAVTAEPVATLPGDDDADDDADDTDTDDADEAALPTAHDAWVRMPAAGQTRAAGYVTFVNDGSSDVTLLGVSSTFATTELHETIADDDGVMRMQHRPEGFVVPAGGDFVMAPGGAHVMLLDIDPLDMAMLDDVELTFDFGDAGELTVAAGIRRDTAAPGGGHDDEADGAGHGDDGHDPAGHDVDAEADPVELDVPALHALDDELHAGVFEPARQRALVADSLAAIDAMDAADLDADVDIDRLRSALGELDAALADGDVPAAAALAFEVHDLTHALLPGDHHGH